MQIQELMKNKTVLYGLIGGAVLIVILIIGMVIFFSAGSAPADKSAAAEKVINEPLELFTTENIGKAIEVQALLAREGITASRTTEGSKTTLVLNKYKPSERDRALLTIVSSGLMDQFVGLEIFDKGDFTSTKEDKRIRLVRAINGELSRLIRKINPIENASVFVSIPEQTMFAADKKPVTATVQIVLAQGDKLDNNKVKAIENLLLGSVSGLTSENISITDTNGNVYNSLVNALDNQLAKLQENDQYMQNKISAQLDKLIGKGKYVVTVSTFLRQVPMERTSITYDPTSKTSVTEQTFTEGLGDRSKDSNSGLNAVSIYLPNGLPAGGSDSSQNRSYNRSAKETQYGVSKTQTSEYVKPGVIEQISIAVTIDSASMPAGITVDELRELIAGAASPKVDPADVAIAYSDSIDPYLASDRPVNLPKPEETGNPWWITVALVIAGLTGGFILVSRRLKANAEKQKQEVAQLKQKTAEQDKQLRDVNLKASQLIEKQSKLAQDLIEQQAQAQQMVAAQIQANQQQIAQQQQVPQQGVSSLGDVMEDVTDDINQVSDDVLSEKVKSWIEKS